MVFIIYKIFNKNKYIIKIKVNGLYKNDVEKSPLKKLITHLVAPTTRA